jgi:hypothetical protein
VKARWSLCNMFLICLMGCCTLSIVLSGCMHASPICPLEECVQPWVSEGGAGAVPDQCSEGHLYVCVCTGQSWQTTTMRVGMQPESRAILLVQWRSTAELSA